MTREDQVLDLLARANPVSNPARIEAELRRSDHPATLEHWSDDMQGTELRTIEPHDTNSRGPWIFAAAAGLVAVLAVGALILTNTGDDIAAQPASPPTTQVAPAADEGAIDVVLSSIAARNTGDLDAWAETLGGEFLSGVVAWPDLIGSYLAANQVITVEDACTVVGTGLVGETLVSCGIRMDDDFLGAGGIFEQGVSLFYVLDGKVIEWVDGLIGNDPGDFAGDFSAWFHKTHPQEAQANGTRTYPLALETVDGMEIALGFVAEFVAQSDTYPIGD